MPLLSKRLIFIVFSTVFCSIIPTTRCVFYYSDIPRFGNLMSNLTVSVGRDAILTCLVENLSVYKVAWLRVDTQTILTIQNHVITKNHRIGVSNSDRQLWRLHIKDTKLTDRGWYMCQINTEPMKSQIAYLDVVAPPNILDSGSSSDVNVSEGDNVTLICETTGVPPPIVMWRREDGIRIPNHHVIRRKSGASSMLFFNNVNAKHSGVYMCIASNGVPPTVSKRIAVVVEYIPKIYIPQTICETEESSSAEIECYIEAYPEPESYWAFGNNRNPIINGTHFKDVTFQNYVYRVKMKLVISEVLKSHYGLYFCISINAVGKTEEAIKIHGKQTYGPRVLTSSQSHAFSEIVLVIIIVSVNLIFRRGISSIYT